jgi:hypothetical protein
MASKIKIGTVSETKNFKKIQRYFPYIIWISEITVQ